MPTILPLKRHVYKYIIRPLKKYWYDIVLHISMDLFRRDVVKEDRILNKRPEVSKPSSKMKKAFKDDDG